MLERVMEQAAVENAINDALVDYALNSDMGVEYRLALQAEQELVYNPLRTLYSDLSSNEIESVI